MKWGQSLAMLIFTSLAIIGATQNTNANDITASSTGLMIVAFVAVAFCALGAVILAFYNEKKVMKTIGDTKILEALEQQEAKHHEAEEVKEESIKEE